MTLAAPICDIAQQPNNELKGIKKIVYENITLPEQYTQGNNFVFGPLHL